MTLLARDAGLELDHDVTRVVAQLFLPGESIAPMKPQAELIAERVRALAPEQARQIARDLLDAFGPRHRISKACSRATPTTCWVASVSTWSRAVRITP